MFLSCISSLFSDSVYILAAPNAFCGNRLSFDTILSFISHQFSRYFTAVWAEAKEGEEFFLLAEQQQLHPLKQTTTSAHLPPPPPSFFL